jgi:integrase
MALHSGSCLPYGNAPRGSDAIEAVDLTETMLTLRQGKTGVRQTFEVTQVLQVVLNRARRLRRRVGSLWLFCTRDGQPYSVSGWHSAWRRLAKRSGIEDMHFHDVRAKALTDAQREAGRDYAQALAGHKSGDMTEAYVRARTTQKVRPLGRIVEGMPFCRNEESGKPR